MNVSLTVLGSLDVATRQLEYLVENMASNQENSSEVPILRLESSDNVIFDVELPIAKRSLVIKSMIENLGEDNLDEALPLKQIKSDILRKVIEFATHHKDDPIPKGDGREEKIKMTKWDQEFIKVDWDTLFEITVAANYLDMKDLLDVSTQGIAREYFKGKSPEVLRNISKAMIPK